MKQEECARCAYDWADQVWGEGYAVAYALAILKKAPRAAVTIQRADLDTVSIAESVTITEDHVLRVDAGHPCIAVPFGERNWRSTASRAARKMTDRNSWSSYTTHSGQG